MNVASSGFVVMLQRTLRNLTNFLRKLAMNSKNRSNKNRLIMNSDKGYIKTKYVCAQNVRTFSDFLDSRK